MIETKRLLLRSFVQKDAKDAHDLFCDEEAMRLTGMYPPFTRLEETENRIRRWSTQANRLAIVLKETGAMIGYIVVNSDSEEGRADTKELGFALTSAYRRHGYMQEAVQAVLKALAQNGIAHVWACCFKENAASEKLIRNLGFEFQREGVYNAPHDREYASLEFRIAL